MGEAHTIASSLVVQDHTEIRLNIVGVLVMTKFAEVAPSEMGTDNHQITRISNKAPLGPVMRPAAGIRSQAPPPQRHQPRVTKFRKAVDKGDAFCIVDVDAPPSPLLTFSGAPCSRPRTSNSPSKLC